MEITKDNWIDLAMNLQGKRMASNKIPKGTLTRFVVSRKFEGTSSKGHPYYGLEGNGLQEAVFCYSDNYDVAHTLNVGDSCECYVDGKFANNLRKIADIFADDEPVSAVQAGAAIIQATTQPFVSDKDKSIVAQNLINRATEIYLHETREHSEFDPIRLTAIAVDMVGIYKETVKHL